jgi:hypothetical protein
VFDDLPSLFYHNVISAYDHYVSIRDGDVSGRNRHTRAALEAAAALFHFREHIPVPHKKERKQVVVECPDYRLVADVTNAAKHHNVTRPTSEGPSLVRSAEDIEERTIVVLYQDEQGEYSDVRTLVFINCTDGVCRNLDAALTNVLNYWGSELKRLGIISNFMPRNAPELPGNRHVLRDEARMPDREMVQGLPFKQIVQLMRFNPSKGCAEPIDLTGAKLEYNIYKPSYRVNITINSPTLGEPIKCSIVLTEEQSFALAGLKTVAERKSYINTVVSERREEINNAIAAALEARARATSGGEN